MINNILVKNSASVKECLKLLNKTAKRILFIVNDNNQMVGSLSDGDIRRGLLQGIELNESIDPLYNKNPFYLQKNYEKEEAKSLFLEKRIEVLPIVNVKNEVISLLDWESFFGEKKELVKPDLQLPVVIMAGGKGTRMAPFTNVLPKPLIPIGDKTILELIIDEFNGYNIKNYYFTLKFKGQMIEAYFNSIEKEYTVHSVWEDNFLGTAGSLKLLPVNEIESDFIVSNCDVIVKAEYDKALKHHHDTGALVTVLSSIQHYNIPYGVIEYEKNGEVTGILEKPEYTFSINTGVYIVNKKAIDYIPDNKIFHMTHLMETLIRKNKKVVTYPVNENDYIDIGQWDEYRAVIERMTI